MYGGNTKYHSNPYTQGTTVPCDDPVSSATFPTEVHVATGVLEL